VVTVRVGDGSQVRGDDDARPVFLEERDTYTGAVMWTAAMPTVSTPGGPPACTLGIGTGQVSYELEGFPSLSSNGARDDVPVLRH